MFRGTTPSITIKLPEDIETTSISQLWVTFSQNAKEVLNKTKSDCTIDEHRITVSLTQAETLLFDADASLEVQLRILKTSGEALASKVKRFRVEDILKDGEISG